MDKLRIKQAVIVEGKYDSIKLSSVIDAVIICTDGFGIYKNKDTAELIRHYAKTTGVVILTDSDTAGQKIRNHIKSIIPDGDITNLYIPEIKGKEKRKTVPSKEGTLGVEGIDISILREIFERSGLLCENGSVSGRITRNDFYNLGLSGKPDSSELRRKLCIKLGVPKKLSAKALVDYVNTVTDLDSLSEIVLELNSEQP